MVGLDRQSFVPLYYQLVTILEKQIKNGTFNTGDFIPSVRNLCERYEISDITARRAILELAKKGLVSKRAGKGMFVNVKSKKAFTVTLTAFGLNIKSYWSGAYMFFDLVRGITQATLERNMSLKFVFPEENVEPTLFLKEFVKTQKVDGIFMLVLIHKDIGYEEIKILRKAKMPYVVIKSHIPGKKISCVFSNDFKGAAMATEYLISSGHRRIGFINGPLDKVVIWRERMRGYKEALKKYKIQLDRKLIKENRSVFEKNGYESMGKLLQLKNRPQAVFVAGDGMAVGAFKAIKKKGLRIPEDISIIGYDDADVASWLDPPLTTIRTSFFDFGEKSAELLFDMITQDGFPEKKVVIEPVLKIRQSCANVKSK